MGDIYINAKVVKQRMECRAAGEVQKIILGGKERKRLSLHTCVVQLVGLLLANDWRRGLLLFLVLHAQKYSKKKF